MCCWPACRRWSTGGAWFEKFLVTTIRRARRRFRCSRNKSQPESLGRNVSLPGKTCENRGATKAKFMGRKQSSGSSRHIVADPAATDAESAATSPQPARPLGEHGQRLWSKIVAEFDIDGSLGIELLTAARQSLDRAEQCAECFQSDGPTVRGPTGIRAHPCIREELSCRNFTARVLRQLGVTLEPLRAIGRPPGSGPCRQIVEP